MDISEKIKIGKRKMNFKISKKLIGENVILPKNCELYDCFDMEFLKCDNFVFGTISDCKHMILKYPNLNGKNYSFFSDISVSSWLPFIKEEYINPDVYFKQSWQLNSNDVGKFCRLNSNNKSFNGFVIHNDFDIERIKNLTYSEDFVCLSNIKKINENIRKYWVCNGEIVEFTNFSNMKNEFENEMFDYANKIIHQYYEPALKYTIDICYDIDNSAFKVVDYNSFSCSKFYNCDINKIVSCI